MKVNGSATLHGPVDRVWETLRDPRVLVRTIPGCERLETVGEDEYTMTVTAGVASIKGTYQGTVRLTDPEPPNSFVLRASGSGNPGTVDTSVTVTLAGADGDTTTLDYAADAVVGGTIAGVGQRVLSGAAKRTAGEFFTNVDTVLTEGLAQVAAEQPASAAPARPGAAETRSEEAPEGQAATSPGGVYEAPGREAAPARSGVDFAKGVLAGAAVALAGVALGGYLGVRQDRTSARVRVFSPDVRVTPKGRR